MGSYSLKNISIADISFDSNLSLRRKVEDIQLEGSIQKLGLLIPLIVIRKEAAYILLSGYKRLSALRSLGMDECPALILEKDLSVSECLWVQILSNWNQEMSELEKGWVFFRLHHIHKWSLEDIASDVMPVLGVPSDSKKLVRYIELFSLPSEFIEFIESGKIPFRAAFSFSKFKKEDINSLLELVKSDYRYSASEWIFITDWLYDLTRKQSISIKEFFDENKMLFNPEESGVDGKYFFNELKKMKFPRLMQSRDQFIKESRKIAGDMKGVNIKLPEMLEDEGYEISIRARKKALSSVLSRLKDEEKSLESLFDII